MRGAAALFYLMYIAFLAIGTILMINLLIALMASTYEKVRESSVLGWRLAFVRTILRKELLTPPWLHKFMEFIQLDWVLNDWAEDEDDARSGWIRMYAAPSPPHLVLWSRLYPVSQGIRDQPERPRGNRPVL